jgi:hypothetical protein
MTKNRNSVKNRITSAVAAAIIISVPVAPLSSVFVAHAASTSAWVTLSSFSGHPGVSLTVSGGNYAQSETIAVTAKENNASIAATSVVADKYGNFSVALSLPVKLAQGQVSITASGVTSGQSATNNYFVSPFNPTITPSATDTIPFGTLTVSGSGYAPNEVVDINFAGGTTTAQSNATGTFTAAVVTTPQVPAASYQLIGVGEASGAEAIAYEYVNGFYPSAAPTSYYVLPGESVALNGSGFAGHELVTVSDAVTAAAYSTFTTNADGSFAKAGAFAVPNSYAGQNIKVVLSGATSGASTTVTTGVGAYYPSISPSTYYVLPGGAISFSGSGFMPNETVDVLSGTIKLATTTADATGVVMSTPVVTVPTSAAGTNQNYSLVGESSKGVAAISIQIGNFNPQVSPSSYYALPGSQLTFTGSGYAPSEVINVNSTATIPVTLAVINADNTGSFTNAGAVTIAYDKAGGTAAYTIVGTASNVSTPISLGVGQLNTMISPSSYYVLPYQAFDVSVSGFAPGEMVTLTNGNTVLSPAVKTDKTGAATFKAVSLPAGLSSVTLIATGATSAATASVGIGMGNYIASVTLDNYYVKPSDTLAVTGSGFAPNEPVTVTAGGTTQNAAADKAGNVTTSVVVPFGLKKGTMDVTITGTLSLASATTTATLAPFSVQVNPSTYYAQSGSPITFTGSGYVPGEKITVSLNGTTVGTETADSKGKLTSAAYTLPFAKIASFTLTGNTSGAISTMNIGLAQFYAGVQLSSYYGNGGSIVTASGSGFAANEVVKLTSGTTSLGQVTASALGAFNKAVTVPYSAPGQAPITATGTLSGATATTSYTVAQVWNNTQLGAYVVPAGQAVNIIGSGYMPNEPVTVTSDRGGISYSFTANALGNFSNSGLVLPAGLTAGNLTLTINGTYSFTSTPITLYVQ